MNGHREEPAIAGGLSPSGKLAGFAVALPYLPLAPETAEDAVRSIAQGVREAIPGVCGAGTTLIDTAGRKTSIGATDGVVLEADRLQYKMGEGPCLSAWALARTQVIADIDTETRWRPWVEAAAGLGIRSALSAPLTPGAMPVGALKAYSDRAGTFDEHATRLTERLALPAAVILANAHAWDAAQRARSRMSRAVEDRDAVSIAVGILMEREHLHSRDALMRMMALSRLGRRALLDVARDVIADRRR